MQIVVAVFVTWRIIGSIATTRPRNTMRDIIAFIATAVIGYVSLVILFSL